MWINQLDLSIKILLTLSKSSLYPVNTKEISKDMNIEISSLYELINKLKSFINEQNNVLELKKEPKDVYILSILTLLGNNENIDNDFLLDLESFIGKSIILITLIDLSSSNYLNLFGKSKKSIYMDYNSTTPILNKVYSYIKSDIYPINPSSIHKYGRMGKKILDDTRQIIKQTFNSHNYNIVFTSSGTEANNLLMKGIKNTKIITSSVEHPSIKNSVPEAGMISVNTNGIINLIELENKLKESNIPILISIILANNETGVIQPAEEILFIAKKYNCILHMDTTQAIGKMEIDMEKLPLDAFTISGHKIGAPNGAGALIFKKNIKLHPLITGGGQEKFLRGGTENIYAIKGLKKALELLPNTLETMQNKVNDLKKHARKRNYFMWRNNYS